MSDGLRGASDVIGDDGRVRVLSSRCPTCIFRPEDRHGIPAARVAEVVEGNLAAGALLTCHATLPYGDHPDYGPAVCAGFWARHGMQTICGRLARYMIGVTRVRPPA